VVGDVAGEEHPPGVHLEVQVAAVRLRLEEDLDAAVLVHGIAEARVPGEDVAVLDVEDPAEAVSRVEQPGPHAGPVVAPLGRKWAISSAPAAAHAGSSHRASGPGREGEARTTYSIRAYYPPEEIR